MAASYSETVRLALARTLFGGTAYTPPSSYDLALFTGDPNAGGVECTGTGYARITSVANNSTNFALVSGTTSRNYKNGIDWQWTLSAGAGWGTPNWVCMFEAGTSNKILGLQIDNASAVGSGQPMRILAGEMLVQILN
jgi:hypothetical protein